ncbi:MAG TPA: COX15/CtaA family protein [Chitinophagales bacterium]|nr:COX15/CtaA family protein [Chitinophagales bacterium]
MSPHVRKVVGIWLLIGCVMVFFQVILGGVTRLTESGLSITQWKPLNGIVPPLNEADWNQEFDLYKEKVQYKIINEGMTLQEFKWIFFWEFFHRFWGRMFAVVFIFPFIYFIAKGYLQKRLIISLIGLFLFGGLQGFVGWIMVKGGLTGVFVPPLRLTVHLVLAFILLGWTVWLTLSVLRENFKLCAPDKQLKSLRGLAIGFAVVLLLQIFLGGIVSGMKAGLAYPTWPDMNGEYIPAALWSEPANWAGFTNFLPQDHWGRTFIQFTHRCTAYLLLVLVAVFYFKSRNLNTDKVFKFGLNLFPVLVLLQATIGIITVLNCVGKIPLSWGMLHQGGAMLLVAETVFVIFHLYSKGGTDSIQSRGSI